MMFGILRDALCNGISYENDTQNDMDYDRLRTCAVINHAYSAQLF